LSFMLSGFRATGELVRCSWTRFLERRRNKCQQIFIFHNGYQNRREWKVFSKGSSFFKYGTYIEVGNFQSDSRNKKQNNQPIFFVWHQGIHGYKSCKLNSGIFNAILSAIQINLNMPISRPIYRTVLKWIRKLRYLSQIFYSAQKKGIV
jgi:hypothetical protein